MKHRNTLKLISIPPGVSMALRPTVAGRGGRRREGEGVLPGWPCRFSSVAPGENVLIRLLYCRVIGPALICEEMLPAPVSLKCEARRCRGGGRKSIGAPSRRGKWRKRSVGRPQSQQPTKQERQLYFDECVARANQHIAAARFHISNFLYLALNFVVAHLFIFNFFHLPTKFFHRIFFYDGLKKKKKLFFLFTCDNGH